MFSTIFRISNESGPRRRLRLRRSLRLLETSVTEMAVFFSRAKGEEFLGFPIQKMKKKRKLELCWLFFFACSCENFWKLFGFFGLFWVFVFFWIGRKFGLLVDSSLSRIRLFGKRNTPGIKGWGWLDPFSRFGEVVGRFLEMSILIKMRVLCT